MNCFRCIPPFSLNSALMARLSDSEPIEQGKNQRTERHEAIVSFWPTPDSQDIIATDESRVIIVQTRKPGHCVFEANCKMHDASGNMLLSIVYAEVCMGQESATCGRCFQEGAVSCAPSLSHAAH